MIHDTFVPLTVSNQHQGALAFAASISDLAGVRPFVLLSEMVQDELDDACGDVMAHLVWLQEKKNRREMDLNRIFLCLSA